MGLAKRKETHERRCILSGESKPRETLLRFVLDGQSCLVPDLDEDLPGRGVWAAADRQRLEQAIADGSLRRQASRGFKTALSADGIDPDLPARIAGLLKDRCLKRLGLERKAGRLAVGFEKVRGLISQGGAAVLIVARDAGAHGVGKTVALAQAQAEPVAVVEAFGRQDLALALGREDVVHAALSKDGAWARLLSDVERFLRFTGAAGKIRGSRSAGPASVTAILADE